MPPRGPFAGGPIIRRGFQTFAQTFGEDAELARELRRLRRDQMEGQIRRGRIEDIQQRGFRPEGFEPEEEPVTGPVSRPDQTDRQRQIEQALAGSRPAEQQAPRGAASDATASTGPGRTVADELKDLRSTGGSPLTPGDVREKEAVSRVADMAASEASRLPRVGRLRQAMADVPEGEQEVPLPGGGTVPAEPPEVRRQREQLQETARSLSNAFDVPMDRAEAAVRLGSPELVQPAEGDGEGRREAMVDVAARMWMENPEADPRKVADQTGFALNVIEDARARAENLQPDLFEDETEQRDLDFLDTEVGLNFRRFLQQNPDAGLQEFQRQTGQQIPQRFRSEAFDVIESVRGTARQETDRRRAREDDFARAFGLSEGPTNEWQSLVLRRAAARGSFDQVRQELQQMKRRNERITESAPTPSGRRRDAEQNVARADRLLQALQRLQDRAEQSQTGAFTIGSDGTIRVNRNQ